MLALLALAFAFTYLHVFIFPITPVVPWGDQSIFLLEARHLLAGLTLYRDVFEFNTPGTPAVYWSLFGLFGVRTWIPDLMLVLLGVGLAGVTTVISRQLIRGPAAFLPAILFLTTAFHGMIDGTHHWYSTLAVMAALAVLIKGKTRPRLVVAGALCGVATWFTSTRGPAMVLGLVAFLLWERRRTREAGTSLAKDIGCLVAAFLATAFTLTGPFAWKAGLQRFVYCTVVFPLRYYSAEPYNNWRAYMGFIPHLSPWSGPVEIPVWLFINALVPLIYILFLVRSWRAEGSGAVEPQEPLMLVNVVGIFLFLSVLPSPGFYRLCSVSIPALIVLVWFACCRGRLEHMLYTTLWVGGLTLLLAEPIMRQEHWRAEVDLPTGRVAYLDASSYDEFRWVLEHAKPSDYLWGDTLICFSLGLGDPAQVPYVTTSAYTRPEQVENVIKSLEKHQVRFVSWYANLDLPYASKKGNIEPLRAYLQQHYHLAKTFRGSSQILERNN